MSVTNTFGSVCDTWSSYCFTWGDCIAGAIEVLEGGARNPAEWGDHPFDNYEDQQKALEDFQIKNPAKELVRKFLWFFVVLKLKSQLFASGRTWHQLVFTPNIVIKGIN